ncbi:MAG: glutamine synthetase [Gordonia sp.]|uniref:glutamine synthetase family protein n=1 Tax=Gordonia sp. (in: high G+C Gram-positive bacteria) TaxID=84139 RepID=UPI000C503683|nr:glutamine synthetase family protein [Gordonia sp. (in: high G+C Gram-positive bacteria)]MAU81536.1 glutamine synthetase [Gordonia sp. (in: high G+C Gram-positive bacteria)]
MQSGAPGGTTGTDPTVLLGTIVNPAGLILAKTVPQVRVPAFASPGLGASPTWHAFAADQVGIAFTDAIGVVGDQRIRVDLEAMHTLDATLVWAPGEFFDQAGAPVPQCARGTLRRVVDSLGRTGLRAMVGHELEFMLTGPEGQQLPAHLWAQYGAAGVLEHEQFVREVLADCHAAGVGVEQFHPEYGRSQFELSIEPRDPVAAADQVVLARIVLGRVARRHGLRVSFSPKPFADGVGCGAHQHISLMQDDQPLFSGGPGPTGLRALGANAIAGLVDAMVDLQGVLSGSVVSGLRMLPGQWAGAFACWGVENREAAVRLIRSGPATPRGANVEVKAIDPSANVYFATAAILGAAALGIALEMPLPPEVTVDPATLTDQQRAEADIAPLSADQRAIVDTLDASTTVRAILGDPAVDALVAVRGYEVDNFPDHTADTLTERFRLAWSV